MEVGRPASPARGNTLGQKIDNFIECRATEFGEGRRPAHQSEEIILLPFIRRAGGDDLLGQDVQRSLWRHDGIQAPSPNTAHQGDAFHQLVPRRGIDAPLGRAAPGMTRAPHPLKKRG